MKRKQSRKNEVEKSAMTLLRSPLFLFKVLKKMRNLGVVGEKRNCLVLVLACLTRTLPKPASVIVKGPTSSGKSTLVESTVRLFPRSCIVERAGLSRTALAYGTGPLKNKILYLNEYHCGKDAQQFTRLLQSQGQIKHEATVIQGGKRRTKVMKRIGTPVVLSTTTDEKVFPDDETRFLSIGVDQSREQTRKIVLARSKKRRVPNFNDLPIWQTAMAMVQYKKGFFDHPPKWMEYVAKKLPLDQVRVRRDWERFLSFCSAVALWKRFTHPDKTDISFEDYCIAYRILEKVFASTLHDRQAPEYKVGLAISQLHSLHNRPITVREIAAELGWKEKVVYKYLKLAVGKKLAKYEPRTHEKNVKRVLPIDAGIGKFLPSPRRIMQHHRELGKRFKYIDPFTGKTKAVRP